MAHIEWELLTKERSKVTLKFFEYSNSQEYTATPDIVEYDKRKMTKPVYDLILGCKTMKELGIALDFRKKNYNRWIHFANEKHQ